MYVAAAVAAGVLTNRAFGYAAMAGWAAHQWALSLFPLVVACVIAVLLTFNWPAVILAVGLTEVSCLAVLVLELLKY
jgi:cytochrome c biogenesis factor